MKLVYKRTGVKIDDKKKILSMSWITTTTDEKTPKSRFIFCQKKVLYLPSKQENIFLKIYNSR